MLDGNQTPDSGWVKSSLSFANGNCVEVADLPGGGIGVRDSKDTAGPVLRFTPDEWTAFLGGVRNGEFDRFSELWILWARLAQVGPKARIGASGDPRLLNFSTAACGWGAAETCGRRAPDLGVPAWLVASGAVGCANLDRHDGRREQADLVG